jgi:hypothetical protein
VKCEKQSEIAAYLKGETPEGEREGLRVHFEQCPACRAELETFDRVLQALGRMDELEPSAGFKWRVREAFLRAHPEFLEKPAPDRQTLWQSLRAQFAYVPAWAISVAAHVLLIAIAAILILSPKSLDEQWEDTAVQAKPRGPSEKGPEFPGVPGGVPRRSPGEKIGHVSAGDPEAGDFTQTPRVASERGVIVSPGDVRGAKNAPLDVIKKSWAERVPKDRRLLGFFDGRTTESQRQAMREAYGGQGTEKAVRAGLEWLARNQRPDGSWTGPTVRADDGTEGTYAVGLTGLAVLAFLAEGHTPKSGEFTRNVQKGLEFLMAEQRLSGRVGKDSGNYMYNHAIASLALVEASLMTRDESLSTAAASAVSYTIQGQNETGGWGYVARSIDNDTSVSGWQILLLRLAKLGGNAGVITSLVQAYGRLQAMTDSEGKVGYRGRLQFPNGHHALTAVGMLSHQMATHTPDPEVLTRQAGVLLERSPILGLEPAHFMMNDLYFAYFGTLAMHQRGGADWERWFSPLRDRLLRTQTPEGAWPANFDRWWAYGGQVYTTAISILILETPVRYPRLAE